MSIVGGVPPTHIYIAVVERCPDTGLQVGCVPDLPGTHSQGETLEELNDDLKEVVAMILDEAVNPVSGRESCSNEGRIS